MPSGEISERAGYRGRKEMGGSGGRLGRKCRWAIMCVLCRISSKKGVVIVGKDAETRKRFPGGKHDVPCI